jgi:hypothetical protein
VNHGQKGEDNFLIEFSETTRLFEATKEVVGFVAVGVRVCVVVTRVFAQGSDRNDCHDLRRQYGVGGVGSVNHHRAGYLGQVGQQPGQVCTIYL